MHFANPAALRCFAASEKIIHILEKPIEDITNSLDQKQSTTGIFIDIKNKKNLKKAFDTINHDIVLGKLEQA